MRPSGLGATIIVLKPSMRHFSPSSTPTPMEHGEKRPRQAVELWANQTSIHLTRLLARSLATTPSAPPSSAAFFRRSTG